MGSRSAQRSILITGCSSGIGRASAIILRERGWQVLATVRREEDAHKLRAEAGVEVILADLANPAQVTACVSQALELTDGNLFAVFNNAAYGQPGALEDLDITAVREQFEVNVFAVHEINRLVIPAMRGRGRGRIVNCSSVLGLIAVPYRGVYCASKFALEALTDTLRLELAGSGIHASLIEPGPIDTRFVDNALAAARRWVDIEGSVHRARYETMLAGMERGGKQTFKLPPESVAAKLVHAVESRRPKRRYYVTRPTYAAAVMRRVLPTAAMDWIAARS
ncbi:MAG: SDR family NAD(P)-dependent oxidoreductase [Hyphomicrobiaceae bacterium]